MKLFHLIAFLLLPILSPADDVLELYLKNGAPDSILTYFDQANFTIKLEICRAVVSRPDGDCNFFLEALKSRYLFHDYETEQCIRTVLSAINENERQFSNKRGFTGLSEPLPEYTDISVFEEYLTWINTTGDADFSHTLYRIGLRLLAAVPEDGSITPSLRSLLESYIRTCFNLEYVPALQTAAKIAAEVRNYDLDALYREFKKSSLNPSE